MTNEKNILSFILRNDVYQSNPLIQARKDFDVIGMRIFFLGLRGLNPHFSENDKYFDADFKKMFIPTTKLSELFSGNTKYLSEIKKACKKLFDAIVELNYADGGFKLMHMFEELEYKPKEGLYLQFSRKMRPYILDLFQSQGYTRINVEYMFKLSSPYAVRLLEILLQYQNIKCFKELMEIKRKITLEELRFALNVPESAYNDRIDNFKRYVLDNSIREIITHTPYIIRYETVKDGRKVIAFDFTMDTFNVPKDDENIYKPKFNNDAIQTLCSIGFTERSARAIFSKCQDEADCFSRINKAVSLLDRQKNLITNRLGFLRDAIENNWQVGQKPVSKRKSKRSCELTRTENFMTPLSQCIAPLMQNIKPSEKLAEGKPRQINIGKKKLPYNLAKIFIQSIRKGQCLELVEEHLREYNTTIEQFSKLCDKNGL